MDRYRTRTVEVEAMRLGTAITLGRGEKGKKGDWLIRGPGHHLSVLDAKTFGIRFEFVPATPTAEDPLAKKGRRGGRRPGPGRTSKRGGGALRGQLDLLDQPSLVPVASAPSGDPPPAPSPAKPSGRSAGSSTRAGWSSSRSPRRKA